MTRTRWYGSIAGSLLIIIAGLVAVVTARTVVQPAAALAATAPTVSGTDISNLSTVSSWPDVQSAGMRFAGIEAADGKTVVNDNYASQVAGALGQGLFVMPYVVADPLKVTGAAQFAKAWPVINSDTSAPYAPGGQFLPIALDLEYQPLVTSSLCYGLKQSAMRTWISDFIAAAKAKTGVPHVVIYTNPHWWDKCTGNTKNFSADPLWIANYDVASPTIPPGWLGYTFWQSSDTATISGISGASPADLDQMQGAPQVLTTAAGTSGSVQLQTLNSLAGQQVSYTASALPAHISLTAAGQLSWTSSLGVGAHQVTVTPAASPPAAVVPSSVSVSVRVHGTIAVSANNRSSTAGNPIWLRIRTSGPDQKAGFRPALRASGLPAGLSMNSAGVVTGWPDHPGRYKITVRATDGLGGAGKATFAWTVRAAADSGVRGVIRQVGGSGKCLNDPGGRTANGTRINLWSCQNKPNQKWTTVADGTLRVRGKCLGVVGNSRASGARLQLVTCNSRNGAQLWQAASGGQLRNPRSGKCLDVPAARARNGTHPVIEPCKNSGRPNEHWIRPAAEITSGAPGRCVRAAGAAAVLAHCANVAAERWQPRPDGTVRRGGKCLTESGTAAGSVLSLGRCSGSAATKWTLVSAGPIATEIASRASHLCVTVPARGTRLIVAACAANPRGTWRVN